MDLCKQLEHILQIDVSPTQFIEKINLAQLKDITKGNGKYRRRAWFFQEELEKKLKMGYQSKDLRLRDLSRELLTDVSPKKDPDSSVAKTVDPSEGTTWTVPESKKNIDWP